MNANGFMPSLGVRLTWQSIHFEGSTLGPPYLPPQLFQLTLWSGTVHSVISSFDRLEPSFLFSVSLRKYCSSRETCSNGFKGTWTPRNVLVTTQHHSSLPASDSTPHFCFIGQSTLSSILEILMLIHCCRSILVANRGFPKFRPRSDR
jgi:hypothetical protein